MILFIALIRIFLQDMQERKVYVVLFGATGSILAFLHLYSTTLQSFFISIMSNLLVVAIVSCCLLLYSNLKLKKPLKGTFGLGDILFFIVLALGFSTGSFVILFVCSLFFTLITSLIFKTKLGLPTIPLAGLQALFVALTLIVNWVFDFTNLYAL
jgi:hypothetical protein